MAALYVSSEFSSKFQELLKGHALDENRLMIIVDEDRKTVSLTYSSVGKSIGVNAYCINAVYAHNEKSNITFHEYGCNINGTATSALLEDCEIILNLFSDWQSTGVLNGIFN